MGEGIEIEEYNNLVKRVERNLLPLAVNGKYMIIEFADQEIPSIALNIFYELQLLGYVPIIANSEINSDFRCNPTKLYRFVAKGALVQIDESSIIGRKGKSVKKFVMKLCKHNLVHFVSSNIDDFADNLFFSKMANNYLRKKFPSHFVNYLQENAKHVRNGDFFHTRTPIKFK